MLFLYDIGYRFYFWLKRFRRWNFPKPIKKRLQKAYEWYDYYFGLFLNRKMIPWFEKHPVKWGLNTKKRDESYTVSLTSFPARIHHVHIAIETLMRQSSKPDNIVLWLAEDQFPDRKLPEKLTSLKKCGLTIRFCDDLKSHKKYYYAFQEYPNDNILLADDDLFYATDTINKLVKCHEKHPRDICAISAQIIAPQITAMPSLWPSVENGCRYVSSRNAQAFTGAGSLFPPKWYPQEVFDKEKAMSLAETADDLWLKAMSLLVEVNTTVVYPPRGFPIEVAIENNQTLFSQNGTAGGNQNDKVWSSLLEAYNIRE